MRDATAQQLRDRAARLREIAHMITDPRARRAIDDTITALHHTANRLDAGPNPAD